jgi:hypothetical protein
VLLAIDANFLNRKKKKKKEIGSKYKPLGNFLETLYFREKKQKNKKSWKHNIFKRELSFKMIKSGTGEKKTKHTLGTDGSLPGLS